MIARLVGLVMASIGFAVRVVSWGDVVVVMIYAALNVVASGAKIVLGAKRVDRILLPSPFMPGCSLIMLRPLCHRLRRVALFCFGMFACVAAHGQFGGDELEFRGKMDARNAAGGGSMDSGMQNIAAPATRRPLILDNKADPRRPQRAAPPSMATGQVVVDENGLETLFAPEPRLPPLSNPFAEFIQSSSGQRLPLFGFDLFQNVPSTFAPLQNAPVTPDYMVGPGDELMIRAWGQIDVDLRAVVDREGNINIPRVGVVNVTGLKFQELPGYLKSAVGRVFHNFDLTVSMGQLRAIQVYVVGQARRPGSYTLSSLSTFVNAVFAAGGPSGKGSMRHVQLKRGNKTLMELDLYDLLLKGDKSKDTALLSGDVIFFPPVGPQVALTGAVHNQAIFELKDGKTPIREAVAWAGGFANVAAKQSATIERIDERKQRIVDEISLDEQGLARELRDGDLIVVRAVSPRFDNTVALKGFVAWPGRYPWRAGMRVSDLLPGKESLISSDVWQKRNAMVIDAPKDKDKEFAKERALSRDQERVTGKFSDQRKMKDEDRREFLSPVSRIEEINWDYAVIERIKDDQSVSLVPFNLGRAIVEGDPRHNMLLQSGDVVTVFSKEDIRVPQEKRKRYVTLEGEFAVPGIYEVQPGETLRQLVARVGGFGRGAYTYGAIFTRESVRIDQQRRLDEVADRLEREFQRSAMERAQTATSKEGADIARNEVATQREFVSKLKQAKAQGRIVLELPRDTIQVKDLPELALEDGDRFFVPATPSTVSVLGAVFNENSFVYRNEKRFGDYLTQAGGPTKNADSSSLY
ncbi:MAG: hypothetical protein RIR70_2113, partial [Pseudomonadota bacterium]